MRGEKKPAKMAIKGEIPHLNERNWVAKIIIIWYRSSGEKNITHETEFGCLSLNKPQMNGSRNAVGSSSSGNSPAREK